MINKSRSAKQISSVSEFVDFVLSWEREEQQPVAFRGQSFHKWTTLPKIFRPEVGLYNYEKNAVRDLIAVHPQEFRDDQTMFDRLVRMQHFDLPTRLLDVTTNPLVALYFAVAEYVEGGELQDGKVQAFFLPPDRRRYYDSDRVSCMANLANLTLDEKKEIAKAYTLERSKFNKSPVVKRLLWFVRSERPHFKSNIDPQDLILPVFVTPKMSNRRIIAQSGAFIIYGARRKKPSLAEDDLIVRRVIIPADRKKIIRGELERLGVYASALFPEIDKAAEFIVRRYASGD